MVPLPLCKDLPWGRRGPRISEELEAVLARFAGVLRYRYATETVRIYSAVVRRWFQFGGLPRHIDEGLVLRFLRARRESVSSAAVNIDIKGLRLFYAVQAELGEASPSEATKLPKQRKTTARLPRVLSDEAVAQLLTSLPLDDFAGLRDFVLIRLVLETGLRPAELVRMEVPDLLTDNTLYVPDPGTSSHRARYIPITDEMAGLLWGYLHARAQRGAGRVRVFWVTAYNRPLRSSRAVWDIVSRRMWAALHRRAGVSDLQRAAVGRAWRGHYPHELRATCCARWLANGMPLEAAAKLMGHADVSTTARYLGLDIETHRAAMALHPRATRQFGDDGSGA